MIERVKQHVNVLNPIEGRTWEECAKYIHWRAEQAYKEQGSKGGCIAIEDEEVYSWARHYFMEQTMEQEWQDHIAPPKPIQEVKTIQEVKPTEKKPSAPKHKAKDHSSQQLMLF